MYSLVDRRATHHKITEKIETKQQELPNRVTAPVLASLLDFRLFSIIYLSDKRTVSTGSPNSISRFQLFHPVGDTAMGICRLLFGGQSVSPRQWHRRTHKRDVRLVLIESLNGVKWCKAVAICKDPMVERGRLVTLVRLALKTVLDYRLKWSKVHALAGAHGSHCRLGQACCFCSGKKQRKISCDRCSWENRRMRNIAEQKGCRYKISSFFACTVYVINLAGIIDCPSELKMTTRWNLWVEYLQSRRTRVTRMPRWCILYIITSYIIQHSLVYDYIM